MKVIRKYGKPVAVFLALNIITEIFYATAAYAITGNNSMPEYRSFEPVATTNMVNIADGSFTYNIPLLDIPNGYPLNLSYHSNEINNEAQSSWVGFGWTLNPGAINRMKNGFPDEFNGESVTYHNRMPKNWTLTASTGGGMELFTKEGDGLLGANLGYSLRYNNYNGVGRAITGGVSVLSGMASLNFTYSQGRFGFNPEINPGAILEKVTSKRSGNPKQGSTNDQNVEETYKRQKDRLEHKLNRPLTETEQNGLKRVIKKSVGGDEAHVEFSIGSIELGNEGGKLSGTSFKLASEEPKSYPSSVDPYEGLAIRLKLDVGINLLPVPVDAEGNIEGTYAQQKTKGINTLPVYGYMNSDVASTSANKKSMMDYTTESDKMYEKKDMTLALPIAHHDIFALTGEGLGGSFRAFRQENGTYRKNYVKNETFSVNAGGDVNIASIATPVGTANEVYSVGGNLGGDYNMQTVGAWNVVQVNGSGLPGFTNEDFFKYNTNEKFVLRFSGDRAGNIGYEINGSGDVPEKVNLQAYGLNARVSTYPFPLGRYNTTRVPRSSYVSMHLNEDFDLLSQGDAKVSYRVNEKALKIVENNVVSKYDNRTATYGAKGIGEIASYNNDGMKYVYGLPVYTRNEKELQYTVDDGEYDLVNDLVASIKSDAPVDEKADYKTGHETDAAFATQFLLTQITSPDYVDRNFNGPTPDDYGSYTRFNYTRIAGGGPGKAWYKFRSPYQDASFSHGSLSDDGDNMASFSYGEKELYYLHSVVSKTHVAIFTLEDRLDGYGANLSSNPGADEILRGRNPDYPAVKDNPYRKPLKKLSRIDLYSLSDCVKKNGEDGVYEPVSNAVPIKTVRFEYNYELCPGLPNNINTYDGSAAAANMTGKLTLKKVWFEYGGKKAGKISPYKFNYAYPSASYPDVYAVLAPSPSLLNNPALQNPSYNVLNTDRWGNYRDYSLLAGSLGDLARFYPYVDQRDYVGFDPAAWCLKQIVLPSGGEIHVQYEQHDYQYVQDKRAMAMVPLDASTGNNEGDYNKKYYVDLTSIGVAPADITPALADELFAPMLANDEVQKNNRLFFSFLFSLIGDKEANYKSINSEFIEGYARISGYGIDNGKVFFVFKDDGISQGGSTSYFNRIDHGAEFNKREIPQKVCKDFYLNNRQGLISNEGNALNDDNASGESKISAMLSLAEQVAGITSKCMQIAPAMSCVRLRMPAAKAKKGGGVRVKRLLMYDNGASTTGQSSLYGQEYVYRTRLVKEDPESPMISSGVAANEPGVGRRESPLVNPMDKESQSKFEAILYGRDMYGNEGPLGESLLPGASVSYSEVTIRNIHLGNTSTGYEVHEFYTAKDAPLQVSFTSIQKMFDIPLGISGGKGKVSAGYHRAAPHLSQGYSFLQHELAGQMKRIGKYAASSAERDLTRWKEAIKYDKAVAEEHYEYTQPREVVSVMDENMIISSASMGVESELFAESREVYDLTVGASAAADISLGALVSFPCPSPVPIPVLLLKSVKFNGYMSENILRTYVVTKIVRYPAILKRIVNIADGVTHITENVVFDKFTGNPVVSRSYDDFGQNVMNQDFMASWTYRNMRSKALNENTISKMSFVAPNFLMGTSDALCALPDAITKGDFIEIRSGSLVGLYHIDNIDIENNRISVLPSGLNTATIPSGDVDVLVISSGYTNQLSVKNGNIVMNNEPAPLQRFSIDIPQPVLDFLNQLNLMVTDDNGNLVYNATIPVASLPPGLQLVNPLTRQCISADQFPGDISTQRTEDGKITVTIGGGASGARMELWSENHTEEHPMITHLNSLLDNYWGRPIDHSIPTVNTPGDIFQYNVSDLSSLQALMDNDNNNVTFPYVNGGQSGSIKLKLDTLGEPSPLLAYGCRISSDNIIHLAQLQLRYEDNKLVTAFANVSDRPIVFRNNMRVAATSTGGTPDMIASRLMTIESLYTYTSNADGSAQVGYGYTVDRGALVLSSYLSNSFTSDLGKFSMDNEGYLQFEVIGKGTARVFPNIRFYRMAETGPICTQTFDASDDIIDGWFNVNQNTGDIQFEYIDKCPVKISCLKVCYDQPAITKDNVVKASAITFKDQWSYAEGMYPVDGTVIPNLNVYETGSKNKWRASSSYVYRTPIGRDRNYNSGKFTFTLFDWNNSGNNGPEWVRTNTIVKYDPNGAPLFDQDILNVSSIAKYGYGNTLPVLVSQNTFNRAAAFESFENLYTIGGNQYFEDFLAYNTAAGTRTTGISHTGTYSMLLSTSAPIKVANMYTTGNMVIRAWFNTPGGPGALDNALKVKYGANETTMKYVSSAGEWQMYEAVINFNSVNMNLYIQLDPSYTSKVYMDDVRIQPAEAQTVCYVYDKAHRLIAVFDDEHYGMLYEYNMEGVLVRKLKETKYGVKTISETQYNSAGEARY